MIVPKDCYTITDLVLQTAPQKETELVWATITLKDHSKLVVGSFYRPPNKRVSPILELEWKVNYPRLQIPLGTTSKLLSFWVVILTQGGIDWETGLVLDDSPNRLLKEKLIEVISEVGLQQMQREPTRARTYWISSVVISPCLLKLVFPFLVFRTTVLF